MIPVKFLASLLLGTVMLVGFCIYTQTGMSDCPSIQMDMMCPIRTMEGRGLDVTAVSFLVLSVSFVWISLLRERLLQAWLTFYRRIYSSCLPPSYLQEFLARGILNPKIF